MACEQVTLQDVCELIVDCPHTSAKDEGVGYPLIRTPNVGRGRLILTDVHRVSQDVYERRVSRAVPRQGDLILAREAPAGNVAIVPPGIEVCLGQRTMLLRPDSSFVVPEYLNYYLNAPEQRDRMLRLANGATVSHINVADIRNMPVQLPSRGEQSKVAELLNVLDDKIDLNNRLNNHLPARGHNVPNCYWKELLWKPSFSRTDALEQCDQSKSYSRCAQSAKPDSCLRICA